jgi:high-affinity nickel-transport protein
MTITLISVLVAFVVGGIEALGLIVDHFDLGGTVWDAVAIVNHNFTILEYVIISIFLASWIASIAIYRIKGFEDLTIPTRKE